MFDGTKLLVQIYFYFTYDLVPMALAQEKEALMALIEGRLAFRGQIVGLAPRVSGKYFSCQRKQKPAGNTSRDDFRVHVYWD